MAEQKANQMTTIGDLLTRDLSRKIEEIIQVDQADEQSVYAEITEYVATDSIREQYHDLLKAIAEAPSDPDERVGVWVSGFFGSGKSSFAKNLGYALENAQFSGANSLISSSNNWVIPTLVIYSTSLTLRYQPGSSSSKWGRRPTPGRLPNELPS